MALIITAGALRLAAEQPNEPPPRGKAYGYFLKEGGRVLFVYVESDGSRLLELSQCKPKTRYIIKWSADLINWSDLATVQIAPDGTANAVHANPMTHCFYTVERTR